MTEQNEKALKTFELMTGQNIIDNIQDYMLDQPWYDVSNTFKYINLIEKKLKVKIDNKQLISMIRHELLIINPKYWESIYKLLNVNTYKNLGIKVLYKYIQDLGVAFVDYSKEKKINAILTNSHFLMKMFMNYLEKSMFMNDVSMIIVNNNEMIIIEEDTKSFWDNDKDRLAKQYTGTYRLLKSTYNKYGGSIGGTKLKDMFVYDIPLLVSSDNKFIYVTHNNGQHTTCIDYNKLENVNNCDLLLSR